MLTTRAWLILIAATLLAFAGAINFAQRLKHVPPPTDGVEWSQKTSAQNTVEIVAERVAPASSAARAGVLVGNRLHAISTTGAKDSYQQIERASDVQMYLDEAHVGGQLHYLIERPDFPEASRFYEADLWELQAGSTDTPRDYFLNFVGLVYLFIGMFVLFKQGGRAPFTVHFAVLCLAAFVFHFYKPTGALEDLDLAIAFLDDAAFIMFAPIFLHFCSIYPARQHLFSGSRRSLATLLYVPAIALVALTALTYFAHLVPLTRHLIFTDNFIRTLYAWELKHFLLFLVAGACLLVWRFWKSESVIVRQQLKWVVWGSALGILPLGVLYLSSYLFGEGTILTQAGASIDTTDGTIAWLINASVLPLVLIPLTFGNSVVRYRLMDVDIVVRRAAVYALTTLAVAAMIGTVVIVIGFYILDVMNDRAAITNGVSLPVIIAVLLMAAIVMSAAPLKNFLQERIDRVFYGERYDLRQGLLDFGRTLSATTALNPLLDALTSRLQQVLSVERVAIFIEDKRSASGYRVARAVGLSNSMLVPPDFRDMIRTRSAGTGIVRADDLDLAPEATGFVRRALHYYVPCVVRGRMIAVIGLGRSMGGALLSSEDLEILRTISGYVAVAIENSLLYQEQSERAQELQLLKEFNESIVESINVGLLAVDTEGKITGCNSALEEILETNREDAVGRSVEELFAEEFADTLKQKLGLTGWRLDDLKNLYKLHTATRAGRTRVLNVALAPLRTEAGAQTGTLVVIEDATERSQLEEQLQQREKLSSIGLLAAGVAHEINTPLTGVSSYTQMLLGMMPENDPKHALLQKIHRQSDRASNIVNNLLNFSRTGTASEFAPVDINRVLDDTLQLLELQLRRNQIEIKRDYAADLPHAFANAGKLQQVFTNLILNARDAIGEQGAITIETRGEAGEVSIQISDTGIGIAPENLARIYDPFFTTKGVGRGTGLGLAVSYGIVQEHGGHITVESSPGKGATFRLTLPSAETRAARLQAVGD